jgi:hypothetical protein
MSEQAKTAVSQVKNRLTAGKLTQGDLTTLENSIIKTDLAAQNLRAALSE